MSKGFSVEQLQELIRCVADNQIGEFLFEDEGTKLRIRGEAPSVAVGGPSATFVTSMSHAVPPVAMPPAAAFESADTAVQTAVMGAVITSPIVGTFYTSSGPDKDPFVTVGQQVKEGETVFIIESMKVMNEVPADKSGIVAEILVENGAAVEYGQPILRLA